MQVMDKGTFLQPIPMPVQGSSLQECGDSWERQHNIHALVDSGGMILLQLLRYKEQGGVGTKEVSAVGIMPGKRVAMPFFCEGQELNARMYSYNLSFVICHQGGSLNEGHYIAALSVPGKLFDARVQWKWLMTDDNKQPGAASARDVAFISRNCYIIGLTRMLN